LKAKVEDLASRKRIEEMYGKALDAMRSYSGQVTPGNDHEFED